MTVSLTCSSSSTDSACGFEGKGSQIVPLLACKLDMTPHLLSPGVSSGQRDDNISEVDLILNRAGHFAATDEDNISMTVCPRHTKKLPTDWAGRKRNACTYPTHRGPRKSIKKAYRINGGMSEVIHEIHDATVPIALRLVKTRTRAGFKRAICEVSNKPIFPPKCTSKSSLDL